MSSETASFIHPFTFPSSSLLLISFILCSRSLRGGLETWGWGFGSDTSFARIFLFMKELMLVVCLRPLLFGCSKTRTKLKKISYFVTSSTLNTMSVILSNRLFAKETRESFGPLVASAVHLSTEGSLWSTLIYLYSTRDHFPSSAKNKTALLFFELCIKSLSQQLG